MNGVGGDEQIATPKATGNSARRMALRLSKPPANQGRGYLG